MEDIEEYLIDSESVKNDNNELTLDGESDKEDNASLTKYLDFLNSVSNHHEELSVVSNKAQNIIEIESDSNINNTSSILEESDKEDNANLKNIDDFLNSVHNYHGDNYLLLDKRDIGNKSADINNQHISAKSLNEAAATLFNQYLNQAVKSSDVILAHSRPNSSLGKNNNKVDNINEKVLDDKILASNLFNEYLNAALQSPIVIIANSRPSSPVNIIEPINNVNDAIKESGIAGKLYNDYINVAINSPLVLSHSIPSSPSNVLMNKMLIETKIIEPKIYWSYPQNILYGIALSEEQLNAKCVEIDGDYSYDPPLGSILSIGVNALNVTFIPHDLSKYLIVSKSVNIYVDEPTMYDNILESSSIKDSYVTDFADTSVVDSIASEKKGKKKKKKVKKVKTIRTASPTIRNNSNRVMLPPMEVEVNPRSSSATNKNKRPLSTHKGTNGLIMEGLLPHYSELVNGIFKRPVVVSILIIPLKVADTIYESRLNSPVNDRVGRVIASVQEHREQEILKSKAESSSVLKEKTRNLNNFVVKVFDLVDSKEGVYDIVMRDFINLRTELIKELSPEIKQYYQPNSLSWWCTHLKLFLVIYLKPNSEFSVIVDKKAIKSFVKKKMQHHSWMKSTQLSYSSNEESPVRSRNLISASAASMNSSWKKLEDIYYSISLSEKQGKYWKEMKILFSFEVGAFDIDTNESEYENEFFEFSESWLKMEKIFKDIPESQKKGAQWKKLKNLFIAARSQKRTVVVGYHSDLDSIDLSDRSVKVDKENILLKKPNLKKKQSETTQIKTLPSISNTLRDNKRSILKSRKSISPIGNKIKSHSSSSANPLKSNRESKTTVPESNASPAKTAPLSELRESVKSAINKTISDKPVTAIILDEDYPEINQGRQLSADDQADVCSDFIDQFPLLSEKSEMVKNSPIKKEKEEVKKERKQTPEKKGIAIDPFSHPIPNKQYAGPKKIAIDIIKKAREEVSKSKSFINRKISHSEVRLLDSPFAKKVFIPPTDVENLMSDLSVSSWNSSVN